MQELPDSITQVAIEALLFVETWKCNFWKICNWHIVPVALIVYIFLIFFVVVYLKLSFIFDATLSDGIYMTFGVFRRPLWPFEFGKSYMLLIGSVLANDVNLCGL